MRLGKTTKKIFIYEVETLGSFDECLFMHVYMYMGRSKGF